MRKYIVLIAEVMRIIAIINDNRCIALIKNTLRYSMIKCDYKIRRKVAYSRAYIIINMYIFNCI